MTKQPKITLLGMPFFAFLLVIIGIAMGCKKPFDKYYNDTGSASVYVYDKLKQDSNFSIFASGLARVGLEKNLNSGGVYTVFAPVNNAFRTYFASKGYSSIDNVPTDTLFQLLNFHVINNLWYYYSFQQRYITYKQKLFLTRGNKFVNIDVSASDTLKVNGIPVIKSLRDISADNAVIHGIGTLLQPLNNLEQLLKLDPQFSKSTFYKLMQVTADSTYDRFNSYDRNGDGVIDSIFYKTYSLLNGVNTALEYRQNSTASDQGGDPVFTTILMPTDDSLNALIAPALAKVNGATLADKIAALSPTYVQAVLGSYFISDTLNTFSSSALINRAAGVKYFATDGSVIPNLTASQFIRPDVPASNGLIHLINATFPLSDRYISAIGQASMDTSLSYFMIALQTAGLMSTFEISSRTGTYFAPTNAAFRAVGLDPKKRILNGAVLTATQFSNIFKNHVIDQNLATASTLTGSIATNYGNGNTLTFSNSGTRVATNAGVVANVTLPYVAKGPTTNGYVYKVDQILLPNQ